ncbi:MAG TPA: hypothetical protein VJ183_13355 [Chloroflexia bacterium]|nr:hypothetical protein [Chloroflexia bacterium]
MTATTYPISWNCERAREVFITESRQKARDLFLQLHRPFRQIRVDFCKDASTGTFTDEAELRAIVQSGQLRADNRLFFVVGEAGSGKSELCQWLEYTADRRSALPMHIPRSMTSAAHVASLLRQKLADHLPRSALSRTPLSTQARYIALSAIVLLYERGSKQLAPAAAWERLLAGEQIAALLEAYLQSLAPGPSSLPTVDALVADSQIAELCKMYRIDFEPDRLYLVAGELRSILAKALDQTVWLGDLRALLSTLSEQTVTTARRPLLLIEDITAFQLLGDLLLDYLLDLTSGHFDVVIGVTTGFERTQLARATLEGDLTHIHQRLRARFVLTDTTGRSYGLEEDLVGFARAYLHAVKQETTDTVLLDEIFGPGLYPFTETALYRAFHALHEEGNPRQTPRLFIEHVLGATLLSEELPPLALDRSPYLEAPPTHFRSDEVPDERLQSLLRWYGQVEDEVVTLDIRIPPLWGIPVPDSIVKGRSIRVSRTYVSTGHDMAPVHDSWQQELRELQTWLATGGLYPSRETLKRGIERILLELGDPRSLANPHSLSVTKSEIYYARGDERLPIFLDGDSGDQPSGPAYLKVQITHLPEERTLLEELAYLSLSGLEPSRVCQNPILTFAWAKRHWDNYHSNVCNLLTERLNGLTAEELALLAWQLVSHLVGDTRHLPATAIHNHITLPYASFTPWSASAHRGVYATGEALLAHYETYRRLFIGLLTLRDTFIDSERYYPLASNSRSNELLAKLAQIEPNALRSLPYKIRPGNQYLHEVLAPLQRYAQSLCDLDVSQAISSDADDLARRAHHLERQLALDHRVLRQQLEQLRQKCGEVGVTWAEGWDPAMETLRSLSSVDIHSLLDLTRSAHDIASKQLSNGGTDVWEYQRLRHNIRPIMAHPYWEAVSTLTNLRQLLLSTARSRYRRDGRLLIGTKGYKELLETVRFVQGEI